MDLKRWWMTTWQGLGKITPVRRADEEKESQSTQALIREIHEAHRDWVNAQRHFEYAVGQDQVDYAIFAIEAAEKRYEMLLRQAKRTPASWADERRRAADVG